eukprot:COSAG02_NODE_5151_length_4588_cov_2.905324_4_plen_185_part_00
MAQDSCAVDSTISPDRPKVCPWYLLSRELKAGLIASTTQQRQRALMVTHYFMEVDWVNSAEAAVVLVVAVSRDTVWHANSNEKRIKKVHLACPVAQITFSGGGISPAPAAPDNLTSNPRPINPKIQLTSTVATTPTFCLPLVLGCRATSKQPHNRKPKSGIPIPTTIAAAAAAKFIRSSIQQDV